MLIPLFALGACTPKPADGPDTEETAIGETADSAEDTHRTGPCLVFAPATTLPGSEHTVDWSGLTTNIEGESANPAQASAATVIVYALGAAALTEALCAGTQGAPTAYELWQNGFGETSHLTTVVVADGQAVLVRLDGSDGTPWMYGLFGADAAASQSVLTIGDASAHWE